MPAQPIWFQRLPSILAELRTLDVDYVDRLAVERIFGVRQRRARQLMAGLPCLQVGNAVAVRREALIERLETTTTSDRFQWEIGRRTRVAESLDMLRRYAAARRVQLPAPHNAVDCVFATLPVNIDLRPGELQIRFTDATDLATKLFELSQVMANDWLSVEAALNRQKTDI